MSYITICSAKYITEALNARAHLGLNIIIRNGHLGVLSMRVDAILHLGVLSMRVDTMLHLVIIIIAAVLYLVMHYYITATVHWCQCHANVPDI